MGNVPSLFHLAGGDASCMLGGFPDSNDFPDLTPKPPQQGAKRKREEGSAEADRTRPERTPSPKRHHTRQAVPTVVQAINDQHHLAPRSPVMSVRALEAPKGQNEPLKDYDILRRLGESSEGRVFLMKSKKTAELLAVKVLKEKHTRDANRLPEECLIHLNLKMHPHIVFLSQIDIVDNHIWQGLSFENAGDLMDYYKRRQQHPLTAFGHKGFVLHVLIQLSEAIAFLHHGLLRISQGVWEVDAGWSEATHAIIHCDVKPQNLLINFSPANDYGLLPCVRIADFGHATLASSPPHIAGSPLYFCPEAQAADRGRKSYPMSRASDIYTLGLTLYSVITGACLRTGSDPRFLKLPAEYDNLHFAQLLTGCLQVNPKNRLTMDNHPDTGMLHVIDRAWEIRDDLMYNCKTCDKDFWRDWRKACKV